MSTFQSTLFWCVVQVTLFLTVAAPIYLAVRRRHPRAGTWAAAGSLAAVVALSGLAASPWPRWAFVEPEGVSGAHSAVDRANAAFGQSMSAALNKSRDGADGGPTTAPWVATAEEPTLLTTIWRALQVAPAEPAGGAEENASASETAWRWPTLFVAIGVVLSSVHLLAGLVAVRRLVRSSRPLDGSELSAADLSAELNAIRRRLGVIAPVELRESEAIATPATVGWRRPTILLPAAWPTWSPVERRAVLAHELAHIAQHDFAAWLIARAAIVLHFYHPLVRWFARRLQLDQELAADAAAVRLLGDRDSYLRALASLALATPAHRLPSHVNTFIPSRSLLVRRVEMLRTAEVGPFRSSGVVRAARAACLGSLLVVAAVVAGIRPPATPVRAAEPQGAAIVPGSEGAPEAGAELKTPPDGYDFSYVPGDALVMVAIRPNQIAASPRLLPVAEFLEMAESKMRPRIPFAELSQVTLVMPKPLIDEQGRVIHGSSYEYTLFRTEQPFDFRNALTASYGPLVDKPYHGRQLMTQSQGGSITFYQPNERTLISYSPLGLEGVIDDPEAAAAPKAADEWTSELTGPVFAVANPQALRGMIGPQSIVNQLLGPVFDAAERVTVATEDGETFVVRAKVVCREAKDVPRVEQTLQSILVLARNSVETMAATEQPATPGDEAGPATATMARLAKETLETLEIKVEDATVMVTAKIPNAAAMVADVAVPQLMRARDAASRARSQNNLKNLALAALNYNDALNDGFPPAIFYGKSGFPQLNSSGDESAHVPRSWRVELLPMLGMEELYKQYRLDQPWDSEANLKVLKQMPEVYRSPYDDAKSTNTSYFAVTGPGTVFDGEEPTPLREITDGASNTLLWVEAKRDVPWTKPEDIAYDPGKEAPTFGGWTTDGEWKYAAAYCDGSVRMFGELPEAELRGLIEKGDGK